MIETKKKPMNKLEIISFDYLSHLMVRFVYLMNEKKGLSCVLSGGDNQ